MNLHRRESGFSILWSKFRRNTATWVGLVLVCLMLVGAVGAPILSPHDPMGRDYKVRLQPPSGTHWFGTDYLGRDLFTRILYGGRISMQVGLVAVGIALVSGLAIGALAGYYMGWFDVIAMRVMDVMLAFPSILLALGIMAILGPELKNAMLAIGIVSIPVYARLVRASVLTVRSMEYVEAARAVGLTNGRIILKHVLPNCWAPVLVQATLGAATAVLDAAGLSFLGLGAQPPTPEWGAMLADSRQYIRLAPWTVIFPGLAVMVTVLGFNLLGDGLRDAFDPQTHDR